MICPYTDEKAIPETCTKCDFYIPAHNEKIDAQYGYDDDGLPIYEQETMWVGEDCAK